MESTVSTLGFKHQVSRWVYFVRNLRALSLLQTEVEKYFL